MAEQREDLLVRLRGRKGKYKQQNQGCCQDVQGWNQERQGVDGIKLGKGCKKQERFVQVYWSQKTGRGEQTPSYNEKGLLGCGEG